MRGFRARPTDLGRQRARWLVGRYGQELRIARMTAGLTQSRLARLAGLSQPQVSRAERGAGGLSLDQRCRLAAAVGHELAWRLYPVSSVRLRDSGQLDLARAIVAAAHPSWHAELEVPIAPGDLRAADMVLEGRVELLHIEIERVLVDVQEQLRAGKLKRQALAERHQRPVRFVLAIADTQTNRSRIASIPELTQRALPVSSRRCWSAIRTGEPIGDDGILIVNARER